MSPTQSKGSDSASSHTGLNPLFFTTPVRHVTVRAVDDEELVTLWLWLWPGRVGEVYARVRVLGREVVEVKFKEEEDVDVAVSSEHDGECVQSGIRTETSTKGSMMCLLRISLPSLSFALGSCWADIIVTSR